MFGQKEGQKMYDDLVKRLKREADSPYNNNRNLLRKAADAVEELSHDYEKLAEDFNGAMELLHKRKKPCWIPVTERLPECDLGAEVGNIEWISCGMVHAGCFGRGGKYRDAYFRTWTDAGEGMDAKDADYWRTVTLPESPKVE